jgi:O-antigen/teichoic acid export membrane protein
MTRYASYFRALATGYGLLAVNIAYSLAMVPLTLTYLGKEAFGLWMLIMQIGTVVQLADAGMTGALNRIFMDYKDDKRSDRYRQTFYTMWLAFTLLGAVIILLIHLLAPWLAHWLGIPPKIHADFTSVLIAYGWVIGFTFGLKPFTMLPFVHQRTDLLNLVSATTLVLGFVVLWSALKAGWGLWALMAGIIAGQLLLTVSVVWICFAKGYLPPPSTGKRLSRAAFIDVFDYGKDRMLITIGFTILQASPAFLITRLLGLEANAVWAVVTRVNQVCLLIIGKIPDMGYPALAEMHVRGEHDLLRLRFNHLLTLGCAGGVLCAVGIAACNRDFVSLWTAGRIQSTPWLDAMLGLWFITLILQKFLYVPASIARNIKDIRFYYLLESVAVVALSILALGPGQQLWMMAAIFSTASLLLTIPGSVLKSARVLDCSRSALLQPAGRIGCRVIIPCVALLAVFPLLPMSTEWWAFSLKSLAVGLLVTACLATLPDVRQILCEARNRFALILARRRTA